MRFYYFLLILFSSFLFVSSSEFQGFPSQVDEKKPIEFEKPDISLTETTQIVKVLSSDGAGGRGYNQEGFDKAAKFVEAYLASHDIHPFFGKHYRDTLNYTNLNAFNVIGRIGPYQKDKPIIVLGAHLDHLGKNENVIYNGANDNASGCTALLQIAGYLSQYEFDRNIIIAFFTAEEIGILGSKDFVRKLNYIPMTPDYMINFEMLGKPMEQGDDNQVYLSGYKMSNLADRLNEEHGSDFVEFFYGEYKHAMFFRSDSISFYDSFKIPAHTVMSFTAKNDDHYHQETDEFEHLDTEYLNRVTNTLAFSIAKVIDSDELIVLNEDHQKVYNKIKVKQKLR